MTATSAAFPSAGRHADIERHFARRGRGEDFDMEARWIARRLPMSASRILDIGCGNGALFPWIRASRVTGIDFAQAGLRQTRTCQPAARLACGDGSSLPFADNSFDVITAQHVIEHLPDAGTALAQWRRVLRPGGTLLVVTPNARFVDPSVFDDPTHRQLFDRRELNSLMQKSGLIVNRVCTIGIPSIRKYHAIPSGWRFRRTILRRAEWLSIVPGLRDSGQSLCCMARKPLE